MPDKVQHKKPFTTRNQEARSDLSAAKRTMSLLDVTTFCNLVSACPPLDQISGLEHHVGGQRGSGLDLSLALTRPPDVSASITTPQTNSNVREDRTWVTLFSHSVSQKAKMNSNTDLTHHHLANLRHEFSTGAVDSTSVQASPSEPARSVDGRGDSEATPRGAELHEIQATTLPVGLEWDGDMELVIDALQELDVQSPITATEALSPDSPWFRDNHLHRDADGDGHIETETVASSPQNSSWSRTVAPPKAQRARLSLQLQPQPKSPVNLYTFATAKGLDTDSRARTERRYSQDWYRDHATLLSHSQQLYETYSAYPASPAFSTARPEPETESRTRFSSIFSTSQRGRYAQLAEEVNVLILSWATTTATNANAKQQIKDRINTSTDSVRNCFKRLGYRVQCRLIPEDYPTAAVETILAKFLADSDSHERKKLLDIREPIMSSEGDVLLIFDCHQSMRSNGSREAEDHMLVDPGLTSSSSTKQLLGAYGPVSLPRTETPNSSSNGGTTAATQMTQTLCRTLDSAYARGDGKVSVQRLCSYMKEELRQDGTGLDQRVFVTQLGGRHLLGIELPVLFAGIGISVGGGNDVGGGVSRGYGSPPRLISLGRHSSRAKVGLPSGMGVGDGEAVTRPSPRHGVIHP